MNFLADGAGRSEKMLHKIMVVIMKVFGTVFKGKTITLNCIIL